MSNGHRSSIIICIRVPRLVRENHHPRIEDDLFDEISNRRHTRSSYMETYGKEDMATSDDTEPNGISCVYFQGTLVNVRKRDNNRPGRAINPPFKWHQ